MTGHPLDVASCAVDRSFCHRCIHTLFEERVRQYPNSTAIIFNEQQMTYHQLNCRANRLAYQLRDLGVCTNSICAIVVERSLDMIVGILGILKAGGVYLPLDPVHPVERLSFILADSQPNVIVTQSNLANRLPNTSVPILCLDTNSTRLCRESMENPYCRQTSDDLAYVMYTSGTTGTPKGVSITHHNVVRLFLQTHQWFHFSSKDVWTLFHSIGFDFSVWEIWGALLYGGKLVIVPKESLSPLAFYELLSTENVTFLNQTPSAFTQILFADKCYSDGRYPLSLRFIILDGEMLNFANLRPWIERHGDCSPQIINMYGITEVTVHVTYRRILQRDLVEKDSLIGIPIPDLAMHILNDNLKPVSIGQIGEIYISGAGIAKGYLNHPELTESRFLRNPFSQDPSERLYRTGDLARQRTDGDIAYIGRLDDQVKIRGYRIELSEIQKCLEEHDLVTSAVVVVRENEPGIKRLVAYVVLIGNATKAKTPNMALSSLAATDHVNSQEQKFFRETNSTSANECFIPELRSFMKLKLPEYMRPSVIVEIDQIPLTANGKIDTSKLLLSHLPGKKSRSNYIAPKTEVERFLSRMWRKALSVDNISVRDRLFDLGGDSLLATLTFAKLRERYDIDIDIREFYLDPTVAGLASQVTKSRTFHSLLSDSIAHIPRDTPLPLAPAQKGLWFLYQLRPLDTSYNLPLVFRISGKCDVDTMERALNEVIMRHETLRTNFLNYQGEPVAVIHPQLSIRFQLVDLTDILKRNREAAAQRIMCEKIHCPFDLTSEPLIRSTIFRMGEDDHILLVLVHHIVSDGWSAHIIAEELIFLYDAYSAGHSLDSFPRPAIQFVDYADWQRRRMEGEWFHKELSYWKSVVAEAPHMLNLPSSKARPEILTSRGVQISISLSPNLVNEFVRLCLRENATLFAGLLTAFEILLHRMTHEDNILVGTTDANRNCSEVMELVGLFVNTIVFAGRFAENPSFTDALAQTKKLALRAQEARGFPFEALVKELQPDRALSYMPIVQVLFNMLNLPQINARGQSLQISEYPYHNTDAKFDLALHVRSTQSALDLILVYSTDLFDSDQMNLLLEEYRTLLESIVARPHEPIRSLSVMPPMLRRRLTAHKNVEEESQELGNYTANGKTRTSISAAFENIVTCNSNGLAVCSSNYKLTYSELNSISNRIAHTILSCSDIGQPIAALLMGHDALAVAGILGILKAGWAYVPMDPMSPSSWLAKQIEDTSANVIVTDSEYYDLARDLLGYSKTVLNVEFLDESMSSDNPNVNYSLSSLAYIIYTSGTTGLPKGIRQSHDNVLHFASMYSKDRGFRMEDKIALLASYCTDAAALDIFGGLLCGATIYPFDLKTNDISLLPAWLRKKGISVYHSTPTVFRAAFSDLPEGQRFLQVRMVAFGGEEMRREDYGIFNAHFAKPCVLCNQYGLTEVSLCLQSFLDYPAQLDRTGVTLGYPVGGVECFLLDSEGKIGEIYGEIGVRTAYLSPSCFKSAGFSAVNEVLVAHENTKRIFKTGDIGRLQADGSIIFVGRKDRQHNVRGFRVELSGIEEILRSSNEVGDCAVTKVRESDTDRLVAFVVANGNHDVFSIRKYMRSRIPSYMVPDEFVMINELPRRTGGKVNYEKLADGYHDVGFNAVGTLRTDTERVIAEIWGNALGLKIVNGNANFFDLGGHSLLSVKVLNEMQNTFGNVVSLRNMFLCTLRQIATEIDS
jgi:amino acid adenylation domain-containing protein